MCGLFGYFSTDPASDRVALKGRLMAAQVSLHHRGPDDRGLETFSISQGNNSPPFELMFGHTRLSIIDLSSGGHQPMHSGDGRFSIVFNGEIYNYLELRQELKSLGYVFHNDSDTEVLLAAWARWGVDGLRRLKGMFAFAIYDRVDNSLTLVRDPFGIKPLFYHHNNNNFSFASEIPALKFLLQKHPEINLQRLYEYLVYNRYDNSEDTFFQGIYHLLPGHLLRVKLDTHKVGVPQRWWYPSIENRVSLSFEDAADKLKEIFLDNIRLHLRSDVPIGVALSGGVDSSAIVCAIRYLQPNAPIHTFSYVAHNSAFNEEKWIDIVNKKVNAIAHKITIKDHEINHDIDDVVRAQGEPFGDLSVYAQSRVFKAAKEAKIKVMLDGQGADEMFAGYEGYPEQVIKTIYEQKGFLASLSFLFAWIKWPGRSMRLGIVVLLKVLLPEKIKQLLKIFKNYGKANFIDYSLLNAFGVKKYYSLSKKEIKEPYNRNLMECLREELTKTRLRRLLRYADRNAMSHSIENRVPFLTANLVEFVLSLPENYLVSSSGETKYILKRALRGIVPDQILDRKDKVGFNVSDNLLKNLHIPQITNDFKSFFFLKKNIFNNKTKDWKIINFLKWTKIN